MQQAHHAVMSPMISDAANCSNKKTILLHGRTIKKSWLLVQTLRRGVRVSITTDEKSFCSKTSGDAPGEVHEAEDVDNASTHTHADLICELLRSRINTHTLTHTHIRVIRLCASSRVRKHNISHAGDGITWPWRNLPRVKRQRSRSLT